MKHSAVLWFITGDSGVLAVSNFRVHNRRQWAPRRLLDVQTITWIFVVPDISNWPRSYLELNYHHSSSSVICQTTGPKPLPKRFHHTVRSRASSFNWQYPLLSLRSSSSFLRLLPRLLVTQTYLRTIKLITISLCTFGIPDGSKCVLGFAYYVIPTYYCICVYIGGDVCAASWGRCSLGPWLCPSWFFFVLLL